MSKAKTHFKRAYRAAREALREARKRQGHFSIVLADASYPFSAIAERRSDGGFTVHVSGPLARAVQIAMSGRICL